MALNKSIFNDPFLSQLEGRDLDSLSGILDSLDKWFGNFSAEDKPLALKLLLSIDYYNEARFSSRLEDFYSDIRRILFELGLDDDSIVIVVTDGQGDSSNRHAYDMGFGVVVPRGRSGKRLDQA